MFKKSYLFWTVGIIFFLYLVQELIWPSIAHATPPTGPTNLLAGAVSDSQINLVWRDNATTETGYKIERSPSQTTGFVVIVTLPANTISYQNIGLNEGLRFYYRVYAYLIAENSTPATANVTTYLKTPTNLTANTISDTQINLSWTDNSTQETTYDIERKEGTGTFSKIATLSANTTTYSNIGLPGADHTYTYRVRARNLSQTTFSQYSNEITAATLVTNPPIAPSGLDARSHNWDTNFAEADSKIDLSWQDNSDNESGFELERSLSADSGFAKIADIPTNTTSYVDSNLEESTSYYYRIRSCISSTCSDYASLPIPVSTLLKTPTSLTAVLSAPTQVDLTWTDNSQRETQYIIERVEGSPDAVLASDFHAIVDDLAPNTTSYSDTTVSTGAKTYSYLVYAVNLNNGTMSWYSNWPSITTQAVEIIKSVSSPTAAPGDILTYTIDVINHSTNKTFTNLTITDPIPDQTNFVLADNNGTNNNGVATWNITTISPGETKRVTLQIIVKRPPNAPSNLIAQPVSSSEVNLTWQDNSDNEYSFIVEFSANSDFSESMQIWGASNITSMLLTGLNPQTKYYFRVAAYDLQIGNSAWSNTAEATTF